MARGTEVVEGRECCWCSAFVFFLENRNGGYCHRVSALMEVSVSVYVLVSIICTCVDIEYLSVHVLTSSICTRVGFGIEYSTGKGGVIESY